MAGCELSLPSYFLHVMTGHYFSKNLTWLIIMIIMLVCEHWLPYYISHVSRHLIWLDVNFGHPAIFLHVMTGHSFKNLTWPIFTIIMLACEHCLP